MTRNVRLFQVAHLVHQAFGMLRQTPHRIVVALRDPPDRFLLELLLYNTRDGSVVEGVLPVALHYESVVRQHADLVQHLAQLRRVPAPRRSSREHQLVRHDPAGAEQTRDSIAGLGCNFHGRLDVGLDHKLLDADLGRLLTEPREDIGQRRRYALREEHRKPGPEPHPHDLGVLALASLVRVALGLGHLVDRVEDPLQGGIGAHQRVAARHEDVLELRVLLEVLHQLAQLLRPSPLGRQLVEIEVQLALLEAVHPLAGGAESAAGPTGRVGDKNRHVGVAPVYVVVRR